MSNQNELLMPDVHLMKRITIELREKFNIDCIFEYQGYNSDENTKKAFDFISTVNSDNIFFEEHYKAAHNIENLNYYFHSPQNQYIARNQSQFDEYQNNSVNGHDILTPLKILQHPNDMSFLLSCSDFVDFNRLDFLDNASTNSKATLEDIYLLKTDNKQYPDEFFITRQRVFLEHDNVEISDYLNVKGDFVGKSRCVQFLDIDYDQNIVNAHYKLTNQSTNMVIAQYIQKHYQEANENLTVPYVNYNPMMKRWEVHIENANPSERPTFIEYEKGDFMLFLRDSINKKKKPNLSV